MDFTRILHLREFVKVDTPAVPTVIGMVGELLLSLGAICIRYMDVAPLPDTPGYLSLFFICCGGGS